MALECSRGALLLLCLAACLSQVGAGIIPGTKGAPVHLGGGFKIENMDAFAMTVGAMVLSVISLVLAVAALILAVLAYTRTRAAAPAEKKGK